MNKVKKQFFPYYVDKERLLDIYAVINDGYADYEEITTSYDKNTEGNINGKVGFKIFKVQADMQTGIRRAGKSSKSFSHKKVQTISSMLNFIISSLSINDILKTNFKEAVEGDFVYTPITLSNNSLEILQDRFNDILRIMKMLENPLFGGKKIDNKQVQNMIDVIGKACKTVIDGNEVIFENDNYGIVANINKNNYYQSVIYDLIDCELMCLCKIKKVYDQGTELLKNTIFTNLKNDTSKDELIAALTGMSDNDTYNLDCNIKTSIKGKRVYEIQIVSLSK